MKEKISGIIVVEGKADENVLKAIFDCEIIKTNGYDVKPEDIMFLKKASEYENIVVLTDSDKAGEEIRSRLNKSIFNIENVKVNIDLCDKNGKHGVAECDFDEIYNVLKPFISKKDKKPNNITKANLINLGLIGDSNSKEKRDYLSKKLSLGTCNSKNILNRLLILRITLKEVKEALEDYGNK